MSYVNGVFLCMIFQETLLSDSNAFRERMHSLVRNIVRKRTENQNKPKAIFKFPKQGQLPSSRFDIHMNIKGINKYASEREREREREREGQKSEEKEREQKKRVRRLS